MIPSDNDREFHLLLLVLLCDKDGIIRRASFNDGGCTNLGGVPIDGDTSELKIRLKNN